MRGAKQHRAVLVLLYLLAMTIRAPAQKQEQPASFFLLTGVSARLSPNLRAWAYYGFNHQQQLRITYLHAALKLNEYITLDPGWMHVTTPKINGVNANENIFLGNVLFTLPLKQLMIEDRNMLWTHFRKYFDNLNYYRNRLRVIYTFKAAHSQVGLYMADEGFYSFDNARWSRNRAYVGAYANLLQWLNIDFSYGRQNDYFSGNRNLFFLFTTIQLEYWGVFSRPPVKTSL